MQKCERLDFVLAGKKLKSIRISENLWQKIIIFKFSL